MSDHQNLGPSVHDLVDAQIARHPDRIALVGERERISYREIGLRAERLARQLADLGVTSPDVAVGIFLERSLEFVVTMLAVLKAGANYVPLDPNYPSARLELMLQRTDAPVVVTSEALAVRIPAGARNVVLFDELAARSASSDGPLPRVHPDQLAYTMFTSGSTGEPKAVVVTHRGIVRTVQDQHYFSIDANDVVLHNSSTSFDAATLEIWSALAHGARLIIGPPGPVSVVELGVLLRKHGVTAAVLPTGLFHLMVDERLEDLTGLRQLLVGGDVLSPDRARRVLAAVPGCRLVNGYGPTEVTTFTTCHTVADVPDDGSSLPIGKPVRRTRVYVLDDDLRPVVRGSVGRIFAGGDGLARGYLHDAARTAERFLPDPWVPGERMYDTGDLGRWLPDRSLEFAGRADQQIKRRGFRVEPSEIEEALHGDPAVRDAVVVPEGSAAEDRILVAYLLAIDPTARRDEVVAAVRERMRDRLPSHLIPDQWVVREAFPLNPNGKVDRRALAATANERIEIPTTEETPEVDLRGDVESALAGIWRELFERERIGRDDDFFDLGGHSLLASRMVSRVRTNLGVDMPLAMIFDHSTVADLAAHLGLG